MMDLADDFNLTLIVEEPTQQGNILVLFFTTYPDLVDKAYIFLGVSDHDAVICDINLKSTPPTNSKRKVYNFKRADMEGLERRPCIIPSITP